MTDEEKIPKVEIFNAIVSEAAGFYGLIITIASAFLGGTLVFIEKIAPTPSAPSLWILGFGWFFLIGSIMSICWVRLNNLESGRLAIEKKYSVAKKLDRRGRCLSRLGVILLGVGIFLLLLFGLVNLGNHRVSLQEQTMSTENTGEQRSIPFGSTGPKKPNQPNTIQPTGKPATSGGLSGNEKPAKPTQGGNSDK